MAIFAIFAQFFQMENGDFFLPYFGPRFINTSD